MFLYAEQDVNLAQQSCLRLKNFKIAQKNVENPGKSCFAVGKEWVNTLTTYVYRYIQPHSAGQRIENASDVSY